MTIQEAWCRETSSDPNNWTPENPAYGQCAVTALVVQDLLGGKLMRGVINGVSHYWNVISVNTDQTWKVQALDLTAQQFHGVTKWEGEMLERSREYVLSFPDTKRRYELLKARINGV